MDNVDDTSELIFDRRYLCSIAQVDLVNEEEIRERGIVHSGDKEVDRMMMSQMVSVYLPIADIAEHLANGSNIRVTRENAKIIYDSIGRHLNAWAYFIKHSINTRIAPIDDLRKLDQLAQHLFKFLRYDVKDNADHESEIIRRLRQLNASPLDLSKKDEVRNEEDLPTRTGFEEVMKQLNIKSGTGRGW